MVCDQNFLLIDRYPAGNSISRHDLSFAKRRWSQ